MHVFLSYLICALSGGSCHVTIPNQFAEFDSLVSCERMGMLKAPEWQTEHPGWVVSKIRCSPGNKPHDEEAT